VGREADGFEDGDAHAHAVLGSSFAGGNCQVTPNDCCMEEEDRTTKGLLLFDDMIACQRGIQKIEDD
jgi:hypothetical protein